MEKKDLSSIIPGMPSVIICDGGPRTTEDFRKLGIKIKHTRTKRFNASDIVVQRIEKFRKVWVTCEVDINSKAYVMKVVQG